MSGSNFSIFQMNCSQWKWKARRSFEPNCAVFRAHFHEITTTPSMKSSRSFEVVLFLRDQAVRWDKNKPRSMMCEILRCEVNSTPMINAAKERRRKVGRSRSPLKVKIIKLKSEQFVQVRMCCKWRGWHQGWECSERKICHRASGILFVRISRRFPMNFPSA